MDEHKVPLDKIEKVTIPAVVACEVPGCSWLIPNERGSFQEYNHHLCQHTDEERQALAAAAEAFFKAAHIDGVALENPGDFEAPGRGRKVSGSAPGTPVKRAVETTAPEQIDGSDSPEWTTS